MSVLNELIVGLQAELKLLAAREAAVVKAEALVVDLTRKAEELREREAAVAHKEYAQKQLREQLSLARTAKKAAEEREKLLAEKLAA